jgi:GT2 family glycosyltransferase
MTINLAVLITCHNRKDKTLDCLHSLFNASLPLNYNLDVFLVDDGSTDGTSQLVKKNFPEVTIVLGDGNLFWNQGMRLAWKTASTKLAYDYYLWLNDDTMIYKHALDELLICSDEAIQNSYKRSIIVGACEEFKGNKIFSYGGRTDQGKVIPNGNLQECTNINGNTVLIPNEIYQELGNLCNDYTHGIGDNDYGLRAIESGYKCYTSKTYIATCTINETTQWDNPEVSLRKRWQLFHSPLGLNIKEYNTFRKKFWGKKWILFSLKAYTKVLFPKIYKIIKK